MASCEQKQNQIRESMQMKHKFILSSAIFQSAKFILALSIKIVIF